MTGKNLNVKNKSKLSARVKAILASTAIAVVMTMSAVFGVLFNNNSNENNNLSPESKLETNNVSQEENKPNGGNSSYAVETDGTINYVLENGTYSVVGTKNKNATTVTIPATFNGKNVTSIGYEAFNGYSNLTSVTIPEGIEKIDNCAFYNCKALASITLPNSLKEIGDFAFRYSGLNSIGIPANVEKLGTGVFYGCASASNFRVDESNQYYSSKDLSGNETKCIMDKACEILIIANYFNTNFPSSIKTLGKMAFSNFTEDCADIQIQEGIETIDDYCFDGWTGLSGVYIPSTVTKIGNGIFANCYNIGELIVAESNPVYRSTDLEGDEMNAILNKDATIVVAGCESSGCPDSVNTIGDYAFYYSSLSGNCSLPNQIETIGNYAFY